MKKIQTEKKSKDKKSKDKKKPRDDDDEEEIDFSKIQFMFETVSDRNKFIKKYNL